MSKSIKRENSASMMPFVYIALSIIVLIFLISAPQLFGERLDKSGILEDVSLDKDNFTVTISLPGGTEYNSMFTSEGATTKYYHWLNKGVDKKISFTYQKGGLLEIVENNFRSVTLYLEKNATVKQVIYKEDGVWWYEKPPVRVVFDDGSSLTFYGSSDNKFNRYSEFIACENEQIIVHYLEEYNGDVKFNYIEKPFN